MIKKIYITIFLVFIAVSVGASEQEFYMMVIFNDSSDLTIREDGKMKFTFYFNSKDRRFDKVDLDRIDSDHISGIISLKQDQIDKFKQINKEYSGFGELKTLNSDEHPKVKILIKQDTRFTHLAYNTKEEIPKSFIKYINEIINYAQSIIKINYIKPIQKKIISE